MKARLVKDPEGKVLLLCENGSISEGTSTVLANFLSKFHDANRFNGDYGKWNEKYPDITLYPGETIGIITDGFELVLKSFEPFAGLLDSVYRINKYVSTIEYAKKHNKSVEIIKIFCREGRIYGAVKKGGSWMIPEDAPYPVPPERRREGYRGPRKNHI